MFEMKKKLLEIDDDLDNKIREITYKEMWVFKEAVLCIFYVFMFYSNLIRNDNLFNYCSWEFGFDLEI